MRNGALFILLFFTGLVIATPSMAEDKITLCDKDISDSSHAFFWSRLQDIVPENLGPGEARTAYEKIFQRYVQSLEETDRQRQFVQTFIALQNDIVAGVKSANLSMKAGLDGHELNSGAQKVADVPCQDSGKPYLVTIMYVSIAYKKVHDASWETLRGAVSRQIARRDQQYADWFNKGLPMWPLETWANGLLLDESDAVKPMNWQLVVARPSVGLGINTDEGINDNKPEMTLAIEPLGYVKYTKKDYSGYWGLSLLLTTGDDYGLGYGLLGRYNNYVLGVVKRDDNQNLGIDSDDRYIFVGIDLYELIHEKNEKFREFKGKVRKVLEKIR